jgi:hypothetical protein
VFFKYALLPLAQRVRSRSNLDTGVTGAGAESSGKFFCHMALSVSLVPPATLRHESSYGSPRCRKPSSWTLAPKVTHRRDPTERAFCGCVEQDEPPFTIWHTPSDKASLKIAFVRGYPLQFLEQEWETRRDPCSRRLDDRGTVSGNRRAVGSARESSHPRRRTTNRVTVRFRRALAACIRRRRRSRHQRRRPISRRPIR